MTGYDDITERLLAEVDRFGSTYRIALGHEAVAEIRRLRAALQEARSETDALKEAAWDAYRILGFDTDGASWQVMVAPAWPDFIRSFAEDMRRDYDEALDELPVAAIVDATDHRNECTGSNEPNQPGSVYQYGPSLSDGGTPT